MYLIICFIRYEDVLLNYVECIFLVCVCFLYSFIDFLYRTLENGRFRGYSAPCLRQWNWNGEGGLVTLADMKIRICILLLLICLDLISYFVL